MQQMVVSPYFPLSIRNVIWFEIHELGFSLEFKHNLLCCQSRHTLGALMVSAEVLKGNITKMMGYTNVRTTKGYAKDTDDKNLEGIDKLAKNMNQIYS